MSSSTPVDFHTLIPKERLDKLVKEWILDDIPSFDVGGLVVGNNEKTATLLLKSPGVFAGKPFFEAVYRVLGCRIEWSSEAIHEGTFFENASGSNKIALAKVIGPVNKILQGERTALNTLSRCSGVATASRQAADVAKSLQWKGTIAGTRKTTPGFRIVEKYGLLVGGVATHRLDLSQMVMLKDNHIWSAGSITTAVKIARRAAGFSQKIEVECQSKDEAVEAAKAGADIVMLDNFPPEKLKADARSLKGEFPHLLVEASGGITVQTMGDYLSEHVDILSQGKLTQGYSCLDFSLKIDH
jgi:nicotinate-nucleotide pyrophosphorylase (carboxylating)